MVSPVGVPQLPHRRVPRTGLCSLAALLAVPVSRWQRVPCRAPARQGRGGGCATLPAGLAVCPLGVCSVLGAL